MTIFLEITNRVFKQQVMAYGAFTLSDTDTDTDTDNDKFYATHFCRCLYRSLCRAV